MHFNGTDMFNKSMEIWPTNIIKDFVQILTLNILLNDMFNRFNF